MKRRRLFAMASVGVVALAAGGVYAAHASKRQQARLAFADLSRCLVGSEGATSENVAVRYRHHQLPLSITLEPSPESWPRTCAPHAQRLSELVSSRFFGPTEASRDDVRIAFDRVADALAESAVSGGPALSSPDEGGRNRASPTGNILSAAWLIAAGEGLVGASSTVAGPPAHDDVLTLEHLKQSLVTTGSDSFTNPSSPLFGAARPGFASARQYCWAGADALRCLAHSGTGSPFTSVSHTTAAGQAPLYWSDQGVFLASDPEKPVATAQFSDTAATSVGANGVAAISNVENGRTTVATHARGRAKRVDLDAELERLFGSDAPRRAANHGLARVSFGQLYFLAERDGVTNLYAARVNDDGVLDQPALLGSVTTPEPSWRVQLRSCNPAPDEHIVIAGVADETFVFFRREGTPVTKVDLGDKAGVFRLLACARGRAVFDKAKPIECTPAGCAEQDAFNPDRGPRGPGRPSFHTARTLLGDRTLVVWGAKQDDGNGVWMKLAPGTEVGSAPARLIVDDAVDDGVWHIAGSTTAFELIGGSEEALLVLFVRGGRELAVRIGKDGSVRPETISEPAP